MLYSFNTGGYIDSGDLFQLLKQESLPINHLTYDRGLCFVETTSFLSDEQKQFVENKINELRAI